MARKKEESRKAYIELSSIVTVRVEPSPEMYENATKTDSDIPNRMKVIEKHSKYGVLIKTGRHTYPSEILDYPVVKALIENGKFSVVGESEEASDEEVKAQKELLSEIKDEKVDGKVELEDLAGKED